MGEEEEEEEGPKEIFTKHLRLFIFLIETNVFVDDDAGGWMAMRGKENEKRFNRLSRNT